MFLQLNDYSLTKMSCDLLINKFSFPNLKAGKKYQEFFLRKRYCIVLCRLIYFSHPQDDSFQPFSHQ